MIEELMEMIKRSNIQGIAVYHSKTKVNTLLSDENSSPKVCNKPQKNKNFDTTNNIFRAAMVIRSYKSSSTIHTFHSPFLFPRNLKIFK